MRSSQTRKQTILVVALASLFAVPAGAAWTDEDMVARGRYMVQIGGCNDCHTPGYLVSEGQVPQDQWLIGDTFGWRGPWGTTYGANLRLFMVKLSEDEWVAEAKTLKRRPPMPWFNLNIMKDDDLRAIYRFVNTLGDLGQPAPDYVPPDQVPNPPYAQFPSPPPNN